MFRYLIDQIFEKNQILVAVLGICSALGVTTRLSIALTMGASVVFVTGFSSLFVSLLRRHIPDSVRIITELTVISLFVIIVDQFLKAYFLSLSKILSVFVGLIITNCLVMGRAEAFAKNNPPLPSFLDGVGAGLGYAIVLAIVGGIRELFGFGELLGYRMIPLSWYATAENPDLYRNIGLMYIPPSAFFILAMLIWGVNRYKMKREG